MPSLTANQLYSVPQNKENSSTLVFGCDGRWIQLDIITKIENRGSTRLIPAIINDSVTFIRLTGTKYANFKIINDKGQESVYRFSSDCDSQMYFDPGEYKIEIINISETA